MTRSMLSMMAALAALLSPGGETGVEIVLPGKPSVSEGFAARELKHHLERATDGTVTIVSENIS